MKTSTKAGNLLSSENCQPKVSSQLALLNKSELADRMALYYTCYPILTGFVE